MAIARAYIARPYIGASYMSAKSSHSEPEGEL